MAVTVAINGVTLIPQPAEVNWQKEVIQQKLDGTDSTGAYRVVTLRAPVFSGGSFNWDDYENSVLTSIVLPAPGDTQRGTGVTYSTGVVSRAIVTLNAPPGGLVRDVEMQVAVIV